jgi:hypothetical protein
MLAIGQSKACVLLIKVGKICLIGIYVGTVLLAKDLTRLVCVVKSLDLVASQLSAAPLRSATADVATTARDPCRLPSSLVEHIMAGCMPENKRTLCELR